MIPAFATSYLDVAKIRFHLSEGRFHLRRIGDVTLHAQHLARDLSAAVCGCNPMAALSRI